MAVEPGVAVVQKLFACLNSSDTPDVGNFALILDNYLDDASNKQAEISRGTKNETFKGAEGLLATLKERCLSPRQNKIDMITKHLPSNDKTLMQLIAEKGLDQFATKLLKEGVDPNLSIGRNEANDDDQALPPVLLAAKHGHWKVLEAFKQHIDDIDASTSMLVINESQKDGGDRCCR